jgi:hypothetical protein
VLYIYVCATPNSRTVSEPPVETGGAHSCARTGNRRRRINLLLSHLMHAPRPAALRALGLGKCSLAANLVVPMQAISAHRSPDRKVLAAVIVLRHSRLGHSIELHFYCVRPVSVRVRRWSVIPSFAGLSRSAIHKWRIMARELGCVVRVVRLIDRIKFQWG